MLRRAAVWFWGSQGRDTGGWCDVKVTLGRPTVWNTKGGPGICWYLWFNIFVMKQLRPRKPSKEVIVGGYWCLIWGFPYMGLGSNESTCNIGATGDVGSIPGLARSPEGGHGNPLQYSCPDNPTDKRAWWATVHRIAKSQTRLKWLSTHAHASEWGFPQALERSLFLSPGLGFCLHPPLGFLVLLTHSTEHRIFKCLVFVSVLRSGRSQQSAP